MTVIDEMKEYARKRRAIHVQPYTFKRWLDEIQELLRRARSDEALHALPHTD